jgi:transcription antitermination factor NusG
MILTYGDVSKLQGQKWHLMEIRSEKTAENILRRIGNSLQDIIKDGACEVFIPVGERDLGVYTLKTSSYIFIRSTSKKELTKFRTITGVLGILCDGEQQRIDKALTVDDEYVQGLIKECEDSFRMAPTGISVGSFVRILDGLDRGFCGKVVSLERDYALVMVELKTRRLLIETPIHNLKDLSSVPPEQQVFYYSDVVKEYVQEYEEEALLMLQQDLKFKLEVPVFEEDTEDNVEEKKIKYGRQKTITAIAKRLMYDGVKDPKVMILAILDEIKNQNIKKPKSIFILYFVLKQIIMETLFKDDPKVKSYKDVISLYGEQWRISPKSIKELDTDDMIPLKSESDPKASKRNSVIKLDVKDGVVSPSKEK